jgi:ABC-type polysaccharide/polyol phosphate transport system ATPase subunit
VASHAQQVIRNLCNKALWLDGGRVVACGAVDRVLDAYSRRDPSLLRSADAPTPAGD